MQYLFLFIAATVALTIPATAANSGSAHPSSDSWGYSSEDSGGSSYLGVDTRDITPDRLDALHLKEEKGVEVTMVDQDAPAGKAGLKEHDVVLTFNGTEVESVEQFRRVVHEMPPGRVVTLGISRNGQPVTVKVQLADRKNSFSFAHNDKDFNFVMPAMPNLSDMDLPVSIVVVHTSMRSGLMVENLTPQLGDFFGAKNGQGVLVRSVERGSRGEKAGFRAGDVIVKINGEAIHDSGDFSHALRSRSGSSAAVTVIRDKKEQTITLAIPQRQKSDLFHESLHLPDISAQTHELAAMQSEMARLGPEIEETVQKSLESVRPELERQAREFTQNHEEFARQMRDLQRQLRDQQRDFEREFRQRLHDRCCSI